MRTKTSVKACLALALAFSVQASVAQNNTETGPIADEYPLPPVAFPITDAIKFNTSIDSTAPITEAEFPFTDDLGRAWYMKVNLVASTYQLFAANAEFGQGSVVTAGGLTADQVTIFRLAAEERRYSKKYPGQSYLQPWYVWEAVKIGLDIAVVWLADQYSQATTPDPTIAIRQQQDQLCRATAANQTANAWALGAIACPKNVVFQQDGKVCTTRPDVTRGDASLCQGDKFYGHCVTTCN